MSSLFLNRIGNPPVIPKPLIWVESHNMFGFDELFFLVFTTKPQSISTAFDNTAQNQRWSFTVMTFLFP